jgi:hypothetical protein
MCGSRWRWSRLLREGRKTTLTRPRHGNKPS